MKSLFLVMGVVFGAALTELCEARISHGSGVHSYFAHKSGARGQYLLKYPVLPWSSLKSRRQAVAAAIASISTIGVLYHSRGVTVVDQNDESHLQTSLYEIMENVVAIHSGLPRIVVGDAGYEEITLTVGEPIDADGLERLGESIVMPDAWTQYAGWGAEVGQQLREALERLPEAILESYYKKDFLGLFNREFDSKETRMVVGWEGARVPPFGGSLDLVEKLDMPILEAVADKQYKPRFPSGFIADIKLRE